MVRLYREKSFASGDILLVFYGVKQYRDSHWAYLRIRCGRCRRRSWKRINRSNEIIIVHVCEDGEGYAVNVQDGRMYVERYKGFVWRGY